MSLLTHYSPALLFYIPKGFLMFSGGIDKQHEALMVSFKWKLNIKKLHIWDAAKYSESWPQSRSANGLVPDPVLVLITLHHKIFALIFSLTDQVRVKLVLESREI